MTRSQLVPEPKAGFDEVAFSAPPVDEGLGGTPRGTPMPRGSSTRLFGVAADDVHLTPDDIARVLNRGEGEDGVSSIDNHIDRCSDCRKLVSEAVRARLSSAPTLSESPPDVMPAGTVVDGRYRIERLAGVGGMGTVYEAHHLLLNQRVALKFMLPQFAQDTSAIERFLREGRAAARLSGPHVGRVLDLGKLDDGTPYLAMEFLVGESLDQRLSREKKASVEAVVMAGIHVSLALQEAHAAGIVHRDIKPGNLFYARRSDGTEIIKVLDFGIAKSVHPDVEEGLSATRPQSMVGSPTYMSPEQIEGRAISGSSDLWSLGVTLYQMLSGTLPFDHPELVELMYAIGKRPHAPIDDVPKPLMAIIDACLAKDPAQRPASAAELVSRFAALRAPPKRESGAVLSDAELQSVQRRRPTPAWVVVAVAVATLVVMAGFGLRSESLAPAPPAADLQPAAPATAPPAMPAAPPVAAPLAVGEDLPLQPVQAAPPVQRAPAPATQRVREKRVGKPQRDLMEERR
jgi:tRNA A-37 threonylcarbamoyl transferase component Bud32